MSAFTHLSDSNEMNINIYKYSDYFDQYHQINLTSTNITTTSYNIFKTMSTETITIHLPKGKISAICKDGLIIARGIPYALAERFQPPRPVPNWTSVNDCTQPSPISPQNKCTVAHMTGPVTQGRTMSEDSLRVSVWAPAGTSRQELLPTMVFIHGGAYLTGAGDLDCYSGAQLASKGVVVVNITYRLGIFGYQPIKGHAPPNLGLMDQIAALQWVQDNVEAFGGNPKSVCVFGESAGADSVYCLLGANGTKGLFHKAILQSAPLGARFMAQQEMLEAVEGLAIELMPQSHDDASIQDLLSIQNELTKKAASYFQSGMVFSPSMGHDPLPDEQTFKLQFENTLQRVPIFIGYTKDEGTMFTHLFDNMIQPPSLSADNLSPAEVFGKLIFQDPTDQLYQQIKQAKPIEEPWFYKFNIAPQDSPWGATHAMEIPFLLGGWDAWKDAPMVKGDNMGELVERVGDQVRELWVAFAKGAGVKTKEFVIDEGFSFEVVI